MAVDCEKEFLESLAIAWQVRPEYETRLAAATAKQRRRSLRRQDLPERLLLELAATADFQYDAALTLIANPHVAFAADQNIRSLLDARGYDRCDEGSVPVGLPRLKAGKAN